MYWELIKITLFLNAQLRRERMKLYEELCLWTIKTVQDQEVFSCFIINLLLSIKAPRINIFVMKTIEFKLQVTLKTAIAYFTGGRPKH